MKEPWRDSVILPYSINTFIKKYDKPAEVCKYCQKQLPKSRLLTGLPIVFFEMEILNISNQNMHQYFNFTNC